MRPRLHAVTLALLAAVWPASGQAPGVPIQHEGHSTPPELLKAVGRLEADGQLLSADEVNRQLRRKSCILRLPPASEEVLTSAALWERARGSHVRLGYYYLCGRCTRWHLDLAGGYVITADGAVATCHHVVKPSKKGGKVFLVAATDDGHPLPVVEVLAADEATDACIVRVKSDRPLQPLPLNTRIRPGQDVWCYSDPLGHPGYFSRGIVNRFVQHWHDTSAGGGKFPVRMNVSTEWAPGSSGSAVLDECGNAIGHVTEIKAETGQQKPSTSSHEGESRPALIVLHSAVRAADVLALVKPPKE